MTISAARVMRRFLADLTPPLGKPGGPCQVLRRIDQRVKNPALREDLKDEVEHGQELTPQEASKVYPLEAEVGVGIAKELLLTSHQQYRMDLRSVTVDDVKAALRSLTLKLKTDSRAAQDLQWGEKVRWMDPRTRLVIVVQVAGAGTIRLITTFWAGRPDPKPMTKERCDLEAVQPRR